MTYEQLQKEGVFLRSFDKQGQGPYQNAFAGVFEYWAVGSDIYVHETNDNSLSYTGRPSDTYHFCRVKDIDAVARGLKQESVVWRGKETYINYLIEQDMILSGLFAATKNQKSVYALSREQLDELKESYAVQLAEERGKAASYDDLADAASIPDSVIFAHYKDATFADDDFFSTPKERTDDDYER